MFYFHEHAHLHDLHESQHLFDLLFFFSHIVLVIKSKKKRELRRKAENTWPCEKNTSYLKTKIVPFSGPSASVKSTLECGSRNIACCAVEKPNHNEFGSIEMNILATRNPTKIPNKSGARYRRLVMFRTPKWKKS